ncbi:MAG: carbohydrate ABC transporter permease [Oscillospiraceae bacterium]|jgi:multiple sugar transport system permease protein|nr:carbohydrate ABC transporter permease [Oscillospiraceae bacterium]
MKIQNGSSRAYRIFSIVVLVILAFLFLFPLYWIVTGAFKNGADINNPQPVWFPTEWVSTNFEKLFAKRSAPLFSVGDAIVGPTVPAAIRWLVNTVFMSVMAMLLTCLTAAMAGYSLAKKRFAGRGIMFSLIVCAMALPKQVILIPLLKEMAALDLYGTLWAVIFPTVGWPFGVFLMKQFAEGIPGEILEATRIDGASELKTFTTVVMPMIKPGIGALAIFTFINSWNDYFMQLVMLDKNEIYTISLGIATLQSETTVDTGLLMAGAALASVPIIIVFLVFQKYFTQGITMGAVKG